MSLLRALFFILLIGLSLEAVKPTAWSATANEIAVVAAENVYGDLVQQLGGPQVNVTNILNNPDQDPHLFEASPSTARALVKAKLVIVNGADYDPWMTKLLRATSASGRQVIVIADLVGVKSGENPHLWYKLDYMATAAKTVTTMLTKLDDAHAADYQSRLASFLSSLHPLATKIAMMHDAYSGAAVTATEPVFDYMADAIGLDMHNRRYQLAVMNNTEPSVSDIAAFHDDLEQRRVRALIYNWQTSDNLSQRLLGLAQNAQIPVVGVSETEPANQTYQEWMMQQLMTLDQALASSKKP